MRILFNYLPMYLRLFKHLTCVRVCGPPPPRKLTVPSKLTLP